MFRLTQRYRPLVSSVLLGLSCVGWLGGCSSFNAISPDGSLLGLISPYRVEVVQGNVVTREMAAQLREGLSRDQVRGLLGSPLLTDIFHGDRWDYVFTIRRQGAEAQRRLVTIYFDNDRVKSFDADGLPSEADFVSSIDTTRVEPRKKPLELNDDQLRALPLPGPSRVTAVSEPASGPLRSYPPLEPLN